MSSIYHEDGQTCASKSLQIGEVLLLCYPSPSPPTPIPSPAPVPKNSTLPKTVIVGYTGGIERYDTSKCTSDLITLAQNGVNVFIWSFVTMQKSSSNTPQFSTAFNNGFNFDCLTNLKAQLARAKLDVVHLVSVGGWGNRHPTTAFSADQWAEYFLQWNMDKGFDGLDWDVEGANDLTSPDNLLSIDLLNLMGRLSILLHAQGRLVTMAPPESYLDPLNGNFDTKLTFEYPEWAAQNNSFSYHGKNGYAYLLAKYAKDQNGRNTFDLIMPQIYESYSHANFQLNILNFTASSYIQSYVKLLAKGWTVDFSPVGDTKIDTPQLVKVDPSQLAIGLANAWSQNDKALFVPPEQAGEAFQLMDGSNNQIRGYMYWSCFYEGHELNAPPYSKSPLYFAKSLNRYLNVTDMQQ